MKEYTVSWSIEVDAEDHVEAAQTALEILREAIHGDNAATVLEVENVVTGETDQLNWENI